MRDLDMPNEVVLACKQRIALQPAAGCGTCILPEQSFLRALAGSWAGGASGHCWFFGGYYVEGRIRIGKRMIKGKENLSQERG